MTRCTKAAAERRLAARWEEQVGRWPMMRSTTPLDCYVRVNLGHVMRHDLLGRYDSASSELAIIHNT